MAGYVDKKNFVPHDLNNLVVTLDGVHKVTGKDSISAEYDDDSFTIQSVADGTGVPVKNPARKGVVTVAILEASASNTKLWELYAACMETNTGFSLSALDSGAPEFTISETYCYIQKPPALGRSGEAAVVEWMIVGAYFKFNGGGYALQAV